MSKSEPVPKVRQLPVSCGFVITGTEALSTPLEREPINYFELLQTRRSGSPAKELSRSELAELLWVFARCYETRVDARSVLRQKRPYPSAGGIYETEIIVVDWSQPIASRYDAISHVLQPIDVAVSEYSAFRNKIGGLLEGPATLIVCAAHKCALEAAYESSESLAWRDAGSLQAILHLTAAALGMRSKLLGILGSEFIASLASNCRNFIAIGAVAIGSE